MNNTVLSTYNVTITKSLHVTSYTYNTTPYSTSTQIIDTFDITSAAKTITLAISYELGYSGLATIDAMVLPTGSFGHKFYSIPTPTRNTYDITINPNPKVAAINQ